MTSSQDMKLSVVKHLWALSYLWYTTNGIVQWLSFYILQNFHSKRCRILAWQYVEVGSRCIEILFLWHIFFFYNILFEILDEISFKMIYNTHMGWKLIFFVDFALFTVRSTFWPGNSSKLKKNNFLALILCSHYSKLQKTLWPLGSEDKTKILPHTSYPYN